MADNEFKILEWDSDYFGFGVASITAENCPFDKLTKILSELKRKNIRLVYWASDHDNPANCEAAKKADGVLCDKKTVYHRAIDKFVYNEALNNITEYTLDVPSEELIELAILSGEFSRFKTDKNITGDQFEGLYKQWIINSVKKKAADAVFVCYLDNKVTAMITVQKINKTGQIGLIAVDKVMQGKNLGTELVNKTLWWSKQQLCNSARVVTQLDNKPACRLYEKCGYKIEKIHDFFHFWL